MFINTLLDQLAIGVGAGVRIDTLTSVVVGSSIEMLADADGILDGIVLSAAVIHLGFVLYAVDMLADAWAGSVVKIDLSIDMRIDFAISVSIRAVTDMLADVLAGVITSVVPEVGVDVLTDVSVNVLTAVMTVLEFIVSVPLTGSVPFC